MSDRPPAPSKDLLSAFGISPRWTSANDFNSFHSSRAKALQEVASHSNPSIEFHASNDGASEWRESASMMWCTSFERWSTVTLSSCRRNSGRSCAQGHAIASKQAPGTVCRCSLAALKHEACLRLRRGWPAHHAQMAGRRREL